jgi:hypothetical protein
MVIVCLGCGHKVDLGDSYDDYSGPVKCNICRTLMNITSEKGKLKSAGLMDCLVRSREEKQ